MRWARIKQPRAWRRHASGCRLAQASMAAALALTSPLAAVHAAPARNGQAAATPQSRDAAPAPGDAPDPALPWPWQVTRHQAPDVAYKVLCAFDGVAIPRPRDLFSGLIAGNSGMLYGTSSGGGAHGAGTVFAINPEGDFSVLYAFGAQADFADGRSPEGRLVRDAAGNLYGTTAYGGTYNLGTVYVLEAKTHHWKLLHSFRGAPTDGANPQGEMVLGADGKLFGTTSSGGRNDTGAVFELSLPAAPARPAASAAPPPSVAAGKESLLYSFQPRGSIHGSYPTGGMVRDPAGNLYGTTRGGGAHASGTVFRIAPDGAEKVLYAFRKSDGTPQAGLAINSAADLLYGTTANGGTHAAGTVFRLGTSGGGAGAFELLHNFGLPGSADGERPQSRLALDKAGYLYGTTTRGGRGYGTVFEVDSRNGHEWVLHRFRGAARGDGEEPLGSLLIDRTGRLIGATARGGKATSGTVYMLSLWPPPSPQ